MLVRILFIFALVLTSLVVQGSGGFPHSSGGIAVELDPLAIHIDGTQGPTANQPWNGFDLTGIGNMSAATGTITSASGSRVCEFDGGSNLVSSTITSAELGFLTGLTQNVEAGLNSAVDAIHDNVASEISAVPNKAIPSSGDFLLIEDSSAANIKKHILISSLPTGIALTGAPPADVDKSGALTGVSVDAARSDHKHDVATGVPSTVGTANAEGTATSLARSDHVHDHGTQLGGTLHADVVASVSAGFMSAADKSKLDGIAPGATVGDADAIHDNVPSEISAITNKATPLGADFLLIEDSADTNNKKHVLISALPSTAPLAHASTHVIGGSDVADGDELDIGFNPTVTQYIPDDSPGESSTLDSLTAHLNGIGNKLESLGEEATTDNLQTTDATTTTIRLVAVAEEDVININFNCVSIEDDGSKGMVRDIRGGFRRATAGATTNIGAVTVVHSRADSPQAYTTQMTIDGNDVDLEIIGAAAETVEWQCKTMVNRQNGTP